MKKVININFQGRVVPIEETAFELLKQYIESLRKYFAREEGRDEIINDIESRIAELFSEQLKKGSTCITDDDVNAVIASMGRPEDFEAEAAEDGGSQRSAATDNQQQYSQSGPPPNYATTPPRGRLYRNVDDKILGGVASGLANYFGIDPVIMRILFVLLIGALFWVYILLWIIIPSRSIQTNITKRLYRSADDRVIAGVCGGLAAYFNIDTWIPRLIFALPLLIALVSGPFNWWWSTWDFWQGPKIITGSLSTTLFFIYVILWIAVPVAVTASEKLEMRGEKVDLNSIRDTVKEEMESVKTRAEKWGQEVKQSAEQMGERAKEFGKAAGSGAKTFAAETGPMARSAGSGFGHAVGVLFKAFFLFVGGILALVLFAALIALLFSGFAFFPLKDFIISGFWPNIMAWCVLLLFLGIPIVALLTWLIRRIVGVRSKNRYLGLGFGVLWTIGLICGILLLASVTRQFRTRSAVENRTTLIMPIGNKLYVDVANSRSGYYSSDWFGNDDEDWPFHAVNPDTVTLNTIRVDVVKSRDSSFYMSVVRFSRGNTPDEARQLAERIVFTPIQENGVLKLPRSFDVSRNEKFRNQQVLVVVEVPVGKRIELDRNISNYDWFDLRISRRGFNFEFEDSWDRTYWLETGKEYIMTEKDGPRKVEELDKEERERKEGRNRDRNSRERREDTGRSSQEQQRTATPKDSTGGYRYRSSQDNNLPAKDTVQNTRTETI